MSTVTGPKGLAESPSTIKLGAGAVVKGRAIKQGADADHGIPATAASANIGIAVDDEDVVERPFPYYYKPGSKVTVEVGAAVSLGNKLASDANGRLIAAISTNPYIAVADEAATTLGQYISATLVDGRIAIMP